MTNPITIEKLVNGGQGFARFNNKACFVWNALPGETVRMDVIKSRPEMLEGIATEIIVPSPERVAPLESHFLSSAPWQILDPDREDYWKRVIAAETYGKIGGIIMHGEPPKIESDSAYFYGYRNKIEFSFAEKEDGKKSLAFFSRGGKTRMPIDGSLLAEPIINDVAHSILAWVNKENIPIRSLKALIVRSNGQGKAIAALFIKDELSFSSYPTPQNNFIGFHLYYSTHKSPASVPTKLLYSDGPDYLITELKSTQLKFGLLSFFQINIPIFERTLEDIAAFLHPKEPLLDFYSGVGAIGLPLSHNRDELIMVDSNEEAIQYAKENILLNARTNASAHCVPSEQMTELITKDRQLIVDPPRAGLHDKVTNTILAKRPPRVIYLSCDLATQARDLKRLEESYKIVFIKLYNFFPRTPHTEGLVVLERV